MAGVELSNLYFFHKFRRLHAEREEVPYTGPENLKLNSSMHVFKFNSTGTQCVA